MGKVRALPVTSETVRECTADYSVVPILKRTGVAVSSLCLGVGAGRALRDFPGMNGGLFMTGAPGLLDCGTSWARAGRALRDFPGMNGGAVHDWGTRHLRYT
jgi:hypothetical protein